MTEHIITAPTPSITFWRRRSFVVTTLVALLALAAGTAIGALVASDSSVTYRSAPASPAQATSRVGSVSACTADAEDGVVVLALIASMPDGAGTRMAASLSPPAQELVSNATFAAPYVSWDTAIAPDAPTVAVAVAPLDVADRQVVLSGLAPERRADVETSLDRIAASASCT
jgi:hypothetical protein